MKICFLVEDIFLLGGVSRVVTTLANQLVEKHSITIVCISENVKVNRSLYNLSKKIEVCCPKEITDIKMKYFLRRCMRVVNKKMVKIKSEKLLEWIYLPKGLIENYKKYYNDNSFDVIIATQGRTSLLLAKATNQIFALCIGWQHNSFDAYFNSPKEYYWNQKGLFQKYIPQLHNYIVLTDDDRNKFQKLGINNAKRIYNPVSLSKNQFDRFDDINKEYDLIFVGRLVKNQKGLDLLIQIISRIKENLGKIRVVVVGDGKNKDFLNAEICRLKLQNNIMLVGNKKNVIDYYSKSMILVSTSRWEGFGLVLVEAMDFGLPVVSFETTGPKEIIGTSDAGILIPKYDVDFFAIQVIELLNNPDKRKYMGMCAIKRAKDFIPEKIEGEWNEIFTSNNG